MNRVILWDALERLQFFVFLEMDSTQCSKCRKTGCLFEETAGISQDRSQKCVCYDSGSC